MLTTETLKMLPNSATIICVAVLALIALAARKKEAAAAVAKKTESANNPKYFSVKAIIISASQEYEIQGKSLIVKE